MGRVMWGGPHHASALDIMHQHTGPVAQGPVAQGPVAHGPVARAASSRITV